MKVLNTIIPVMAAVLAISATNSEVQACDGKAAIRPAAARQQPCVAMKPRGALRMTATKGCPNSLRFQPTARQPQIAPPIQFSVPRHWRKRVLGIV